MRDTITTAAEIVREYGPYPGITTVHGVSHDGERVWLAAGDALVAVSPESGEVVRRLPASADAGTAFDGRHLWQLAADRIHKIDPETGRVLASIPAPAHGRDSGLTWAEGRLWVGEYRARRIHEIDAATGAVLRVIASDRFVTGVTWSDGELWHGTLENEESELRRVDPDSGAVLERLAMPAGAKVTGLEADGGDRFYCGGGTSGTVRAVRRPRRR